MLHSITVSNLTVAQEKPG